MIYFGAITLAPFFLIFAAAYWGGAFIYAAFAYMALLSVLMDQLVPYVAGNAPDGAEFPAADALLSALAIGTCFLLPLTIWAATQAELTPALRLMLFIAAGLWLGQVAHPAAHELIHRGNRGLFRLGVLVYGVLLMGHHASAHRLVHHRAVATPDDPNSARRGEGFWRFALRAAGGGFIEGKRAEDALRRRDSKVGRMRIHPYHIYIILAIMALCTAYFIGGGLGVILWLCLCAHAQIQQLLADYVQHYGLMRQKLPNGRYEPVTARHSWNMPHWFSSALMLNAPRHSDHHAHPNRPYPALQLPPEAPVLPWPLPVACTLALWPKLWRRLMKPHLTRWDAQAQPKSPEPEAETPYHALSLKAR